MPRKRHRGLVEGMPDCKKFIAHGQTEQASVVLGIEEYEALRLKDLDGLYQNECAEQMGLTRQTFQRILQSARSKIAQALVQGLSIKIQGGNYTIKERVFQCSDCSHRWEEASCGDGGKQGYEVVCPKCSSEAKCRINEGNKKICTGQKEQARPCCVIKN